MTKTKVFAAYLPQFHETEDNNLFWGEGFTDWKGVQKAKPLFEGHYQPRIPLGGKYYDLLDPEVIVWQSILANQYGIDGFNIYHYWFKDGKQELQKPAEILLREKRANINYFFTWDNGAWRRSWSNVRGNAWAPVFDQNYSDNKEKEILVPFDYGDRKQWVNHFEYLLPFFLDDRYYKINGKPVFMFTGHNEPRILCSMAKCWNKLAQDNGFAGMYLATKKRNFFDRKILDAVFSYEPETSAWGKRRAIENRLENMFGIRTRNDGATKYIYDYDKVWRRIIRKAKQNVNNEIVGAFVRYDDTPRRGRDAMVVLEESPEKFRKYFSLLYKCCCDHNALLLLLTAWNEWGEGAYLEPDEQDKYSYLKVIGDVKKEMCY